MTTERERDERQTPRFNLWSRSFWRNPLALTFCATITVHMHLTLHFVPITHISGYC